MADNKMSGRISSYAEQKVLHDYFPKFASDNMVCAPEDYDTREMSLHAGAFCLYATTLLTKIYETAPESIKYDATEREDALKQMIKSSPKYSHFADEQVNTMAHEMIIRDIRNCFAHGNFEIQGDVYTKRLNYILKPRRKDFVVDKPIIISKEALLKANQNKIGEIGTYYTMLGRDNVNHKLTNDFGGALKKIILPVEMIKLSEHYLLRQRYTTEEKRYLPIHYALLVTKITYEQDEYYNIFGKDSNMFERIAHIRNSIAHSSFSFSNNIKQVKHQDRNDSLDEEIQKSVLSLNLANEQMDNIKYLKLRNASQETIDEFTEKLKEFFDMVFVDGAYNHIDEYEL